MLKKYEMLYKKKRTKYNHITHFYAGNKKSNISNDRIKYIIKFVFATQLAQRFTLSTLINGFE